MLQVVYEGTELTGVSMVVIDPGYGLNMDSKQQYVSPDKNWDPEAMRPSKKQYTDLFAKLMVATWVKQKFKVLVHCNTLYITEVSNNDFYYVVEKYKSKLGKLVNCEMQVVEAMKSKGGCNIQVLYINSLTYPWLWGGRLASNLSEVVVVGFFNKDTSKSAGAQDEFNFDLNGEDAFTKGIPYRFFPKPPEGYTIMGLKDADMFVKIGGQKVNATQKSVVMNM